MHHNRTRWAFALLMILVAAASWAVDHAGDPGKAAAPAGPELSRDGVADRQVFERFKMLAGDWRGRSTRGWTDETTFRVVAAGSVVVETSKFEAHPGETMLTMYHLDQNRMMLTHYCVARNQPRLQASAIEADGRRVTFSFRDATNLASREQGHMDRVVYQFQDEDHFTSQWSFSKDGKEDWMEEIHFERIR